ncbi:MAG: hypothetical protein IKC01_09130 [Clostridia bacterium]|nr:hypothetical protein [Clostridia bacterium]
MKKFISFLLVLLMLSFTLSLAVSASGDAEIYAYDIEDFFDNELPDGEKNGDFIDSVDKAVGFFIAFTTLVSHLFFPLLIVMISFIVLNRKTVKKIHEYENIYGVIYTNDVLNDMKNIPPQNYNYNPSVFVPVSQESENNNINVNQSFSNELFNAQKENGEEGGNVNEN